MGEGIAQRGTVTEEQQIESERHASGQRRVNILWETTQAFIAMAVTLANIYAALRGIESPPLNNTFFLVVGFYFGRTNHQRVGGVDLSR